MSKIELMRRHYVRTLCEMRAGESARNAVSLVRFLKLAERAGYYDREA